MWDEAKRGEIELRHVYTKKGWKLRFYENGKPVEKTPLPLGREHAD